jgi:hypothetical protein
MRCTSTTLAMVLVGLLGRVPGAWAQVDLAGSWAARMHEEWGDRWHGPDAVDFTGMPLNADGRAKALSYSSSMLAMVERQCLQYAPFYIVYGPQNLQVWAEDEPVTGRLVAWHISGAGDRQPRTIWMDGRPHPPAHALHPAAGFSTGVWEGNTLTVTTTHMKASPMRRNGVPASDVTTTVEHFTRHGDLLAVTAVITDPVYLTEPQVISRTWQLDPVLVQNRKATACWPAVEVERLTVPGAVPHYLPGQNPYLHEWSARYHIPLEAALGGAATLYPEYRHQLRAYTPPARCLRYCCGWMPTSGVAGNQDAPGLGCNPEP